MTRIDFYVLSAESHADPDQLSCRLTAKAFEQGLSVFVHVDSAERAARLDELLWTFRDISFIPHCRSEAADAAAAPVLIGSALQDGRGRDVLLNLGHQPPADFGSFERVIEIVPTEQQGRDAARERYRFYQDQGYTPATHNLGDGSD